MEVRERSTLVLNLFGGPGCGKSTLAMDLCRLLREAGLEAEICPEAAKDLVWDCQAHLLPLYQPCILGEQYRRMLRLIGKTDVVVAESPLLLCTVYDGGRHRHLEALALELHGCFRNLDVYVERVGEYSEVGRREDEAQARAVDRLVCDMLSTHGIAASVVGRGDAHLLAGRIAALF